MKSTIEQIGECAWRLPLGGSDRHRAAEWAEALVACLHAAGFPAVEAVVGFDQIAVWGCPDGEVLEAAWNELRQLLPSSPSAPTEAANAKATHQIPLLTGGDASPDLPFVAEALGLTVESFLERFLSLTFTVAAIGFLPGFPFLEGLPEALALPRRATPRTRVPPGSVAIAQRMACIYPWESPGGWHLIGRTPVTLFAIDRDPPVLLQPGDTVRFIPIPSPS
jgi:KipI family sensor histidine kinase inhibitor